MANSKTFTALTLLLLPTLSFANSALTKQVTIVVAPKSLKEASDGISFKSIEGKEYFYLYQRNATDHKFISKKKSTVCLTIDNANDEDVTSISNGECKTTNSSPTKNIVTGRCHMDSCWWWKVEDSQIMKSDSKESLIKVFVKTTSIDYPRSVIDKKGYPDLPPKKAKWGAVTETFIFCSNKNPAYFDYDKEQKKFVGSIFTGSYGVTEGAEHLYAHICQQEIKPRTDDSEGLSDVSIDKPTDIFNLVR
ncbi:MAG: hypothetical protein PHN45_04060 [Methylococcales bacterium]|nr:hypothetical protein [Methylococcales bacterium]MDD5753911.1 hypothetical protein [Methylococcales bacterium]